jgi:hypothetical protein
MVQEVDIETGISTGLCHTILMEDLRKQWVSAKFLPRFLTEDQRIEHISISEALFQ